MSMIVRGIEPATPAVNARTQCGLVGCGTMLLPDGTCPRCNPPMLRTTAEKLQIAKAFNDPRLRSMAEAEVHAGIATGLDDPDELRRPQVVVRGKDGIDPHPTELPRTPVDEEIDRLHGRIDRLHGRIDALGDRFDSAFAELIDTLKKAKAEPTPTPTPTPADDAPTG